MKVIFSDYLNIKKHFDKSYECIVLIGAFDGFHLGHKKLLDFVNSYNKNYNYKILILTFYSVSNHVFLEKYSNVIFNNRERIYIFNRFFKNYNIDYVLFLKFNKKLLFLNSDDFLNIISDNISIKAIVVGEDFCYGHNRKGNICSLHKYGLEHNIKILSSPIIYKKNNKVSSTTIKKEIYNSNLELANKYLGYDFFVIGKVIKGNQIARSFGYPTANIFVKTNKVLPNGVFLGKIEFDDNIFFGIVSIGKRETLDKNLALLLEVHIFNFDQNIYNKRVTVFLLKYIRDQIKFNSLDELFIQVKKDVLLAKSFLC